MKIAILQSFIPHYREPFFKGLKDRFDIDFYVCENNNKVKDIGMKETGFECVQLKSLNIANKITAYNFFPFLSNRYDVLVLPGEMRSITTWFLLFMCVFSKKKIILWGHGISIRKYLKEEKKISTIRIIFHRLADHIWLYTENEKKIWLKYVNVKKLTALNNTIDTREIISKSQLNKVFIKKKYKITTKLNLIYCARFVANRRMDLMLEVIKRVKNESVGFIIIGDGDCKPDFSVYSNVFDFGAVYDEFKKHELFTVSDLYFQPAWVGLSVVEAMAYGRPVITFKRERDVLQCVEYGYIHNNVNGYIADSVDQLVDFINKISIGDLETLKEKTKMFAREKLAMNTMVNNAENSIQMFLNDN